MYEPTPLAEKWRRLRIYGQEVCEEPLADRLFISRNEKTGCSLNVDLIGSCSAKTSACSRYCYALGGPASFPRAVRQYKRNLLRLKFLAIASQGIVDREADEIAAYCRRYRTDFFRVNGTGDLLPGTVRLVHALAARHPQLQLWVSSRNPSLIAELPGAPNVHVMMSADRTTPQRTLDAFDNLRIMSKGRAFIAWTRLGKEDIPPPEVEVVFEEHQGACRARWEADSRACAATVRGGTAHQNACASCRRCFDVEVRRAHGQEGA